MDVRQLLINMLIGFIQNDINNRERLLQPHPNYCYHHDDGHCYHDYYLYYCYFERLRFMTLLPLKYLNHQ